MLAKVRFSMLKDIKRFIDDNINYLTVLLGILALPFLGYPFRIIRWLVTLMLRLRSKASEKKEHSKRLSIIQNIRKQRY